MNKSKSYISNKSSKECAAVYEGILYEDRTNYFTFSCLKVIDHMQKSTINNHLKSVAHIANVEKVKTHERTHAEAKYWCFSQTSFGYQSLYDIIEVVFF